MGFELERVLYETEDFLRRPYSSQRRWARLFLASRRVGEPIARRRKSSVS